jgi:hypothetical protein
MYDNETLQRDGSVLFAPHADVSIAETPYLHISTLLKTMHHTLCLLKPFFDTQVTQIIHFYSCCKVITIPTLAT